MIAGNESKVKLTKYRKLNVHIFPWGKMKDFHYYLVPLLKKKPDNIIIVHFGTTDSPYKNED